MQVSKAAVIWLANPGRDINTISWLQPEVGCNIVDDYCFFQISTDHWEILDAYKVLEACMLSVQSVCDMFSWIDCVQYGVGILLYCSRKYNNLI